MAAALAVFDILCIVHLPPIAVVLMLVVRFILTLMPAKTEHVRRRGVERILPQGTGRRAAWLGRRRLHLLWLGSTLPLSGRSTISSLHPWVHEQPAPAPRRGTATSCTPADEGLSAREHSQTRTTHSQVFWNGADVRRRAPVGGI